MKPVALKLSAPLFQTYLVLSRKEDNYIQKEFASGTYPLPLIHRKANENYPV
jgi:hypothetical protein